jgi:hypothetical protein
MTTINSGYILHQLQYFNCCAANKGYNRLMLLEKGEEDHCMVEDAALMLSMIKFIQPYSTIYSQASYAFSITSVSNGNTLGITIKGVLLGTVSFTSSSTTTAATAIATFINALGTYTATANTNNVVIYGVNGSADNLSPIIFTATGISLNTPGTLQLSGGDDYMNRYTNTVITTAQITNILNALCNLCNR